jgi:hypothetical protein
VDRQRPLPVAIETVTQLMPTGVRPTQFSPDGTFTTSRMPAGRYLVRVGNLVSERAGVAAPPVWVLRSVMYEGRDVSDVALDLKGPATGIVITFTDRITSLSGSVRSTEGAPAIDATALLFPVDPAGWRDFGLNPRRLKSARVDAHGHYEFPDVPAGDYFVVAVPEEQAAVWREPDRLAALSRLAARLHLNEGDKATQDLRPVAVR